MNSPRITSACKIPSRGLPWTLATSEGDFDTFGGFPDGFQMWESYSSVGRAKAVVKKMAAKEGGESVWLIAKLQGVGGIPRHFLLIGDGLPSLTAIDPLWEKLLPA